MELTDLALLDPGLSDHGYSWNIGDWKGIAPQIDLILAILESVEACIIMDRYTKELRTEEVRS